MKRIMLAGSLVALIAMPAFGQNNNAKTNPYNQRLLTGDMINGIEYNVSNEGQGARIGLGMQKGKNIFYLSGSTDSEFNANFYRNQFGIEAYISKDGIEPAAAYNIFNITSRIARDPINHRPKVTFTYLNVNGKKVGANRLYPYVNFSLGKNKSAQAGLLLERRGFIPYYYFDKGDEFKHHFGLEYHRKRYMIAVRSEIGKDKILALHLRWKFKK